MSGIAASAQEPARRDETAWNVIVSTSASLVAFLVYLSTLLREVDWWDAAELTLQSYLLGVTHPPGYPVYTLIGKFFTLLIPDPAIATNMMSALFTGLSVYMLCITALALGRSRSSSVISSLVFALVPVIWSAAVMTEVYNVNMFFIALVFFILARWREEPRPHLALLAGALFGISMGTYLANILILPAIILLMLSGTKKPSSHLFLFVALFVVTGCLAISLNYFISLSNPPFGSLIIPDSAENLVKFVTGDQYGTLRIHSPLFYKTRLFDHGSILLRNLLGVGIIIGLFGLAAQWRKDRSISVFFMLALLFNLVYFTFFDVDEYYNMVTPSYFILCIWMAYGMDYLRSERFPSIVRIAVSIVSIAVIAVLFATQIESRLERSRNTPVTDFVTSSFEIIPDSAIVIVPWNEFTPLYYHHRALGARKDIVLVQFRNTPYFQELGMTPEWRRLLTDHIGSRAIVSYGKIDRLEESYRPSPLARGWYRIELSTPAAEE